MSCFPCFGSKNSDSREAGEALPVAHPQEFSPSPLPVNNNPRPPTHETCNENNGAANAAENGSSSAQSFNFRELASATKNFRQECLLGESGFGRVFKGTLQSSGQVVAVKQLYRNGMQGSQEFLVEVMMLTLLHHPNLVDLIGYCADGDQRLLVYEYMPIGSLADHLLDTSPDKKPLDWATRMKIASGAALGLEYLHEKANPPVIYRDLKSTNILLDEDCNPRLTDYGLAKLGLSSGSKMYGYVAPEYERSGELTLKSDVYSFGVVLLELITGRKALDATLPSDQQNLVAWAQPYFKDPKRFPELADPSLQTGYPVKSLNQAVGVAAMCLQDEPSVRPLINDVVAALSFLTLAPPNDPFDAPTLPPPTTAPPSEMEVSSHKQKGGREEEEAYHSHGKEDVSNHQKEQISTTSDDDDEEEDSSSECDPREAHMAYHHENGGGSSESLYNEDEEDSTDERLQEDTIKSMQRGSKSRTRSKKGQLNVSNKGSARRNSSRHNSRKNSFRVQQQRVHSNSRTRSKGKSEHKDGGSSGSESDSSVGSDSRGKSYARSISSTSKFSLDSRCYSNTDIHDEGSHVGARHCNGNPEEA